MVTLRYNSFYLVSNGIVKLAISLISVPLLIRFLGLERYGVWAVILSLVAITSLLEFGIPTAMTNKFAELRSLDDREAIKDNYSSSLLCLLTLALITFVILWSTIPNVITFLFKKYNHPDEVINTLRVMSFVVPINFLNHWVSAIMAGFQRYDLHTSIDFISNLFLQTGTIILAINKNLVIIAFWWIIINLGIFIGHLYLLRKYILVLRPKGKITVDTIVKLIRFGTTQWFSSFGSVLFGYADRILINYFLGPAVAGMYSAATSIVVKINNLSAIPIEVIPPAISEARSLILTPRIHQIFLRATKVNGLGVISLTSLIIFWADLLAILIVGQENGRIVAKLLVNLSLIYGTYSLNAAGFYTAVGIGKPIINAKWGMLSGLLTILLLITLTRK